MPLHDWSRVPPGLYHDFHLAWVAALRRVLNSGLLPEVYYATTERVTEDVPELATHVGGRWEEGSGDLAAAPMRSSCFDRMTEGTILAARRRRLVIRHTTGDRIVAVLEFVSPGNKENLGAVDAFVDKAASVLDEGYHLLLIDLFPPGPFDPAGTHGAVWARLGGAYEPPTGKPLTLADYAAGGEGGVRCYVEPTAVGTALIPMPLFLDPGHYVNVPLEATYQGAYEGEPRRWKRVLEGELGK